MLNMADQAQRQALGERVRARRVSLGMSVRQAAASADVSRQTWTAVESGGRATEDYIYGAIERALGWRLGSVEDVFAGKEPTLIDGTSSGRPTHQAQGDPTFDMVMAWAEAEIRKVWGHPNPNITDEQRRKLVSEIRAKVGELLSIDEQLDRSA